MTDPSPVETPTQDPDQKGGRPWWMYAIVGFFALGIAAAMLGVRTCL